MIDPAEFSETIVAARERHLNIGQSKLKALLNEGIDLALLIERFSQAAEFPGVSFSVTDSEQIERAFAHHKLFACGPTLRCKLSDGSEELFCLGVDPAIDKYELKFLSATVHQGQLDNRFPEHVRNTEEFFRRLATAVGALQAESLRSSELPSDFVDDEAGKADGSDGEAPSGESEAESPKGASVVARILRRFLRSNTVIPDCRPQFCLPKAANRAIEF
ncbi:hypothetical protein OIU34_21875 [Pararhizobium sp. BT-229]|uniref:hypothetical protein n=1 Tax=Pararhizobium sp. BT-229 TaxID=2986923 RepID=UPI0021F70E7B|nr:hypothetical protein [Pararhizobium sp. BT-229]MCV9964543.1 hypothetical protein [Pararhizobium sp. BT-229]